ncbi:MAG: O-antigen ligase family protein [Solirubrobacteraceae bacterium]|nr:O-antigen ligase family protein [Solirubrobacteraceae bacterium]
MALALTPVAIRVAGRTGFLDQPKGYKGHAKAIPYLGGSAVVAAFCAVLLAFGQSQELTLPLVAATLIVWLVGTIDDRRNLSPAIRVLVEVGVATGLWVADLGWSLGVGPGVDLVATVVTVLAVINAFNLFDNMDGASSTMAFATSLGLAALGAIEGDTWLVVAAAALAGSCLGFLPYNLARPQARIFLGDGGSMPIGLIISALVMTGASQSAVGWEALALGFLLVAVPSTDTALVIVSRRRKGISVLTGGRDHLTHRTRRHLTSPRAVAVTLGLVQLSLSILALVALSVGTGAASALAAVVALAATGVVIALERTEDRLVQAGDLVVPQEALDRARAKREQRPDPLTIGDVALLVFALGAGLSTLAFGFYSASDWVPIGLGVILVAAIGAFRRPPQLGLPGALALIGLAGLGFLGLLSSSWAASSDQAITSGNLWLVLAGALGLALVLVRTERRALTATALLGTASLAVGLVVAARLMGPGGGELFLGGRLHEPLGYVNAEATVFLMGSWLCLAAAERRQAWLAGLGLGAATLLAGLTLLSQSRGVIVAAAVSLAVVAAVVPGRQRRALAVGLLAVALSFAAGPLLDVYDAAIANGGATPTAVVHEAVERLLAVAALAGLVWGIGVVLHGRLGDRAAGYAALAGRAALVSAAVIAVMGVALNSQRIEDSVQAQWQAFVQVGTSSPVPASPDGLNGRLQSGSGNRYEYWRVAWVAFTAEPIGGVGAGNFDRVWQRERRVPEDVRQAHSIELQALSELGILGGLALATFLAGIALAVLRSRRPAVTSPHARTLAVAGTGVVSAWLTHTSVDWQHLIPGTTAIALLMLAVLARPLPVKRPAAAPDQRPPTRRSAPHVGIAVGVCVALLVSVATATLLRQGLADHARDAAFAQVSSDPASAIADADRALKVNPDAPRAYYAKAAALARMNRGADAAAVLEQGAAKDPTNFVTWTLMGDLATRRGLVAEAARYYDRALRLNPLDPGVQALAGSTEASGGIPAAGR